MKVECLLLVFVFTYAVAEEYIGLGNWTAIGNTDDPRVTGVATFAVTTYDNKYSQTLKLEKVIKGDIQPVKLGTLYRLTISATNGSSSNDYETVVFETTLVHIKRLVSFVPVPA